MILYFSGTGNSRYIAEVINSVIEDKLVSINECLKNNFIRAAVYYCLPYICVAYSSGSGAIYSD